MTGIIASLILFTSSFALASLGGTSVTGGGQGVTCASATNGETQLLDLYEARTLYHLNPSLGPSGLITNDDALIDIQMTSDIISAQIDKAESRMKKVQPVLPTDIEAAFALARRYSSEFNLEFKTQNLSSTLDSGMLAGELARHCTLSQVAVFRTRKTLSPELLIDENAWDNMIDMDRVALILHEGLHLAFPDSPDTTALRQVVIYLTADKSFRKSHEHDLLQLIQTRRPLPDGFR